MKYHFKSQTARLSTWDLPNFFPKSSQFTNHYIMYKTVREIFSKVNKCIMKTPNCKGWMSKNTYTEMHTQMQTYSFKQFATTSTKRLILKFFFKQENQ